MAMLEIVVGSYEELLLGYNFDLNSEEPKFEQSFTDHSHIGCVKSVAISKRGVLASGSTDEVIRLFNLKSRKDLGCLMRHEGSVTNLEFFGRTHMFSGGEDGAICVWKIKKWECVRTLRGHKGPVHSIAIHPTGKMALSVSRDKTMKTWNLMTGRRAYTTNTKLAADLVQWSPDGKMYLIAINNKVDIYSMETSQVVKTIQYIGRIYVMTFVEKNTLVLAGEGGDVQFYDLTSFEKVHEIPTDTNRVRGACILKHYDYHLIATGSSDGTIQLWKILHDDESWNSEKLISHDTNFRLTCLAMTIHLPKNKEATEDSTQEVANNDQDIEDKEAVQSSDEDEVIENLISDIDDTSSEDSEQKQMMVAKKRKQAESSKTTTDDAKKASKKSKSEVSTPHPKDRTQKSKMSNRKTNKKSKT